MFHPKLVIATEKRNDLVSTKTMNRLTGKYMKLELKADVSRHVNVELDMRQMVIRSKGLQHCIHGWVQWNVHITTWNVKLDNVLCILQNRPRKKLFSLAAR